MLLKILKGKLHRAVVTEARLDYVGSLTLDPDHMEAAGIVEHESVLVANVDTGSRFETYAITGQRGSRVVCVNGAAAHLARPGHRLIVLAFALMTPDEATAHTPKVVIFDSDNRPVS